MRMNFSKLGITLVQVRLIFHLFRLTANENPKFSVSENEIIPKDKRRLSGQMCWTGGQKALVQPSGLGQGSIRSSAWRGSVCSGVLEVQPLLAVTFSSSPLFLQTPGTLISCLSSALVRLRGGWTQVLDPAAVLAPGEPPPPS